MAFPRQYADNTDSYELISFPDVQVLEVVFHEATKTEQNYDYITFFRDESHSAFFGEQKYSGGRGGSTNNFPGLNGTAPLYIPASSFVLHFHSDGSNNVRSCVPWGFRSSVHQ